MFERLSRTEGLDLVVFHGCDFPGTKVINAKGDFAFKRSQLPSIPIRLNTSNGLAVAPFSPSLILHLMKFKPHVILCEGASNLPNNLMAYTYRLFSGARIIQWGLGEIKDRRKSRLRRLLDAVIVAMERSADACLAYSSRGCEYYQRIGVPKERIFVAVNVIDTDRTSKLLVNYDRASLHRDSHSDAQFVVLFVGALIEPKRVDLLLRAFKLLITNHSIRAKLLIVGDGADKARLIDIMHAEQIPRVQFVGQVIDNVSEYFLAADVFVLPGLGGLAVSEALLHGLPVIASIGDGCEKDLLSFGGGILDEDLNVERLADYLWQLSSNNQVLEQMQRKARWTIEHKFNVQTYIDNVLACIQFAVETR